MSRPVQRHAVDGTGVFPLCFFVGGGPPLAGQGSGPKLVHFARLISSGVGLGRFPARGGGVGARPPVG